MHLPIALDAFIVRRDSENCHLSLSAIVIVVFPDHTHLIF